MDTSSSIGGHGSRSLRFAIILRIQRGGDEVQEERKRRALIEPSRSILNFVEPDRESGRISTRRQL